MTDQMSEEIAPHRVTVAPATDIAPDPPSRITRYGAKTIQGRSGTRTMFGSVAAPLAVAGLVVALWTFVSLVLLSDERRFLLPTPFQTARVGIFDSANLMEQLQALARTAQVALLGLAIAFVLGSSLAILMSQARWIERAFYPWVVVVQTIPILALVPLIGFWFGFNFTSRVLVCVMIALFPVVINTLVGLQSVPSQLHDLFTMSGAGRIRRLTQLQLPHAIPSIFTGLRTSAGLAVIGAIVAEFFFRRGTAGLGRLLDQHRARLQTEQLFTAILWSSLLGIAMFSVFGLLAHLATRKWADNGRSR